MSGREPCGNLPSTGWSLSVWYCHHHQAFYAHQYVTHQDGDDCAYVGTPASIEFGPFDSSTDVLAWIQTRVSAIKHLPDVLDTPAVQ